MGAEGNEKETLQSLEIETSKEKAYGIAAAAANLVPSIGGVIAQLLSGRQAEIRHERVLIFFATFQAQLGDMQRYLNDYDEQRKQEFLDLCYKAAHIVFEEEAKERETLLRNVLAAHFLNPEQVSKDEALELIDIASQLTSTHIRVLDAMNAQYQAPGTIPAGGNHYLSLAKVLEAEIRPEQIVRALKRLQTLGLIQTAGNPNPEIIVHQEHVRHVRTHLTEPAITVLKYLG